jgi:predicted RNA-binding protein YlxR (DUF448 family)
MKQKKIPMRMCVVTHERLEKKNLIRVVKTSDGIIIDPSGKLNGRGFYLKKDIEVINKAKKDKILDHLFNENVLDEVYESAIKECEKNGR